jgi:hypothetical protein
MASEFSKKTDFDRDQNHGPESGTMGFEKAIEQMHLEWLVPLGTEVHRQTPTMPDTRVVMSSSATD